MSVVHMNRLRTEREAKKCENLTIVFRIVDLQGKRTAVEGVPEAYYQQAQTEGSDFCMLRVGKGLVPCTPFTIQEEGLLVYNVGWRVTGKRGEVFIPWSELHSVAAFLPPPPGGTSLRRAA